MGRTSTAIVKLKDAAAAYASSWASSRLDSWQNTVTALGTVAASLNWHAPAAAAWLDEDTLEAMYIDDPMARRIIREPVDAAFRQGFHLQPPKDLDADKAQDEMRAIEDVLDAIDAVGNLKMAEYWGRLYGRGGLMLGANDGQSATTELDVERVRELKWVRPIKYTEFSVSTTHDDPDEPLFGEPEVWLVQQTSLGYSAQTEVHESRIVLTRAVPTHKEDREENDWRDIPVLQGVYAALRNYDSAMTGIAQMLVDCSQAVLKIRNLAGLVADDPQPVQDRMRILEMARALHVMPIDAGGDGSVEEDFFFAERSFAGVAEAFDRILGGLASSVGWPQTYLFGRSPAGENATGDSDRAIWDDLVASDQRDVYKPHLQLLVTMAAYATGATDPEGWEVVFEPLRQETPTEIAARRKTIAETDVALIGAGVLDEIAVAKWRYGGDEYNEEPPMIDPDDLEAMNALQEQDRERALNPPEIPDPFAANAAAPAPPEFQEQQPAVEGEETGPDEEEEER